MCVRVACECIWVPTSNLAIINCFNKRNTMLFKGGWVARWFSFSIRGGVGRFARDENRRKISCFGRSRWGGSGAVCSVVVINVKIVPSQKLFQRSFSDPMIRQRWKTLNLCENYTHGSWLWKWMCAEKVRAEGMFPLKSFVEVFLINLNKLDWNVLKKI